MIHFRRPPSRYDSPLRQIQREKHAQLRNEIEEERVSRELVDRRNSRLRRSQNFRLLGEVE